MVSCVKYDRSSVGSGFQSSTSPIDVCILDAFGEGEKVFHIKYYRHHRSALGNLSIYFYLIAGGTPHTRLEPLEEIQTVLREASLYLLK